MTGVFKLVLLLLATLLALSACAGMPVATPNDGRARNAAGDQMYSMTTPDGRTRSYLVHTPPANTGISSYPVVLMLHGGLGSAEQIADVSGMSRVADTNGFLAVYPQGANQAGSRQLRDMPTWNAGNCCGYAMRENVDDVAFMRQLVSQLAANYTIDTTRIFVTGMSNGGMMALRLACEAPDLFAGVAAVAGSLQRNSCNRSRTTAILMIHGTADTNVPYQGGIGSGIATARNDFLPVEQQLRQWAARNGCSGEPKVEAIKPLVADGTTIDRIAFAGCAAPVLLYRINGGTHAWPGGNAGARQEASRPTQAFNASQSIWAFFSQSHR